VGRKKNDRLTSQTIFLSSLGRLAQTVNKERSALVSFVFHIRLSLTGWSYWIQTDTTCYFLCPSISPRSFIFRPITRNKWLFTTTKYHIQPNLATTGTRHTKSQTTHLDSHLFVRYSGSCPCRMYV